MKELIIITFICFLICGVFCLVFDNYKTEKQFKLFNSLMLLFGFISAFLSIIYKLTN